MTAATTQAPPRATKRTRTAPIDPATVVYDADRSTQFTEVYPVPSRTADTQTWLVTYDTRTPMWRCPCPATVAECAHVTAAKLCRLTRWWRRNWESVDDKTLLSEEPRRRRFLNSGETEDRIAHDTLGDEVARRMAERETTDA